MNFILNDQIVSFNFLRIKIIRYKFRSYLKKEIKLGKLIRYILAVSSSSNQENLLKSFWRCRGVYIGKNVYLNKSAVLDGVRPDLITICSNTVIGGRVAIITHKNMKSSTKVFIGPDCFISFGSIVLPGAIINSNSTVGAGSVVTKKTFPSNSVIAGNPAKIIKNE